MATTELTPEKYIGNLSKEFQSKGNSADALQMTRYLKDHFPFFGLKSPIRKEISRAYISSNGLASPTDWKEYVLLGWNSNERELQYFSQEYCMKFKKYWVKNDLDQFEYMITHKSWWDSVDYIASNIVGGYFWKYPDEIRPVIDRWKHSSNIWLVRTAILFQLKYKEHTDFKLLQEVIHLHKYSKEFFIQKAIGWSLRQYARISPDEVQAFVTETELKPLSRREALKHIGNN